MKIEVCGLEETEKLANDFARRADFPLISRVMKSDDTAQKLYHRLQGNEKSTANIVKAITRNYDEFLSNKLKSLAEERAWLASVLRAIAFSIS